MKPSDHKSSPLKSISHRWVHILGGALLVTTAGCQGFPGAEWPGLLGKSPFASDDLSTTEYGDPNPVASEVAQAGYDDSTEGQVRQVSGSETFTERTKKSASSVWNYMTFQEQESLPRAKELYQEGDRLFRQAKSEDRAEAEKTFTEAAEFFQRASEAAPKTALDQDALYMQGESLFFANRLTDATEAYQKLQKDYPRNRHIDQVAARLFAISRYWIDVAKTQDGKLFTLNLIDPKRPRLDVDGHAIRVLDQIRFDDPTGRLADDATMAAAAEYIRQKKFVEADEFLTDLRETFSDSEHLFLAHLLGIKCKLESYAGPAYSGLVLEEAEKLIQQTRRRFPDKMGDQEHARIVNEAGAEIARYRADRLAFRADYNEDRKNFGAARYYYNEILKNYPNTPHSDKARKRLAQLEGLPDVAEQRLSWLTTIFPDSRSKDPLQMVAPEQGQPSETILR